MSMRFHSTRGQSPLADLRTVALSGLAPDGGLYLPVEWPRFSADDLVAMRDENYQQIAFRVFRPFMQGTIPDDILRDIITKTYGSFTHPDITSLHTVGDLQILELFHGPTLAFKDIALQFVGHIFEYFMRDADRPMTVIGATSGDTGSAAIAALAARKNIDLYILYPDRGPSDIQRKQMTCVDAPNVHAIAVSGSFDDCQKIVKDLFANEALRTRWNLTTVNSINLLRILAQITYYFYAASRLNGTPSFVVPTGNFGDIFAGYAAQQCGLPMEKLVVASNSNDILTRFFATGQMSPYPVKSTLSPSMDIQISSNFERLLFDLCDKDAAQLRGLMNDLKNKGEFGVKASQLAEAQKIFIAGCADDAQTLAVIADTYRQYNYLLDPHTAVGVKVAHDLRHDLRDPVICLATAHPAKFPETVKRATGIEPALPATIASLMKKLERSYLLPPDINKITNFIEERKKHGR